MRGLCVCGGAHTRGGGRTERGDTCFESQERVFAVLVLDLAGGSVLARAVHFFTLSIISLSIKVQSGPC